MKPAAECLIALGRLGSCLRTMNEKSRERLIVREVNALGSLGRDQILNDIQLVVRTLSLLEPILATSPKNTPTLRLHSDASDEAGDSGSLSEID